MRTKQDHVKHCEYITRPGTSNFERLHFSKVYGVNRASILMELAETRGRFVQCRHEQPSEQFWLFFLQPQRDVPHPVLHLQPLVNRITLSLIFAILLSLSQSMLSMLSNIQWLCRVSWDAKHVNIITPSELNCLYGQVQASKEVWTEQKIGAMQETTLHSPHPESLQ